MTRPSCKILVDTYLRQRGEDIGEFVLAREYVGPITSPRYVAGAIRLCVDNQELMGLREWDYVDQLWAYLLACLGQVLGGQSGSTYFPDQPIQVRMTPREGGSIVCVTVDDTRTIRSADAPLKSLVAALAKEADTFYAQMQELLPANAQLYAHVRHEAAELLERLNERGRNAGGNG